MGEGAQEIMEHEVQAPEDPEILDAHNKPE
jgi:hypothetical protein